MKLKFMSKVKALILFSLLLMATSCKPLIEKKTLEVKYLNGEKAIVVVKYDKNQSCNGIFFNNGCIYTRWEGTKYSSNFTCCAVCGIRSYRVIN